MPPSPPQLSPISPLSLLLWILACLENHYSSKTRSSVLQLWSALYTIKKKTQQNLWRSTFGRSKPSLIDLQPLVSPLMTRRARYIFYMVYLHITTCLFFFFLFFLKRKHDPNPCWTGSPPQCRIKDRRPASISARTGSYNNGCHSIVPSPINLSGRAANRGGECGLYETIGRQ